MRPNFPFKRHSPSYCLHRGAETPFSLGHAKLAECSIFCFAAHAKRLSSMPMKIVILSAQGRQRHSTSFSAALINVKVYLSRPLRRNDAENIDRKL